MRNLKKIVAVIMAVALLASMMVPALAAVANEDKAKALQTIGLFKGNGASFDLDLKLSREQGMALIVRALGAESAALAMSAADINAQLANVVDADKIATWARPYAAYCLANGITNGIGGVAAGKVQYGAQLDIFGDQFVILLLRAMGYTTDKDNCWDIAVAAKILTAGQAVALKFNGGIIRDDAAGVLFSAVKSGVMADGKTSLIEKLIADKAVDEAAAATAGFVVPKPAVLKVVGATATNLKEIVVAFDSALNKDEAEKAGNYSVDNQTVAKAKLNADGKSVTLVLVGQMVNQSEFKVTVKTAVKSAAGVALKDDVTVSNNVFDVTIPAVVSAAQAGPDAIKVNFSEPVSTPTAINFKVDGGNYFISEVTIGDDGYSATVKLYTTLPVGAHKIEVKDVVDYVGYKCVVSTLNFDVSKDDVPPTIANIVSAAPEKVVIEFTEDISIISGVTAGSIYHTNSKNTASNISTDGKKLTILFDTNKLPNGTAYLTIAKEVVKDGWNNKNAEVKDLAISVVADTVKPEFKSIEAKSDKQIVITFTEDLSNDNGTFKILDAAGKDVTNDNTFATSRTSLTTRTLDFTKALSGSNYTIVIEGIKDVAGNEMNKVSVPVSVTDTTPPVVPTKAGIYTSKNIVKITFEEIMKAEDLLNLANYQLVGNKYLNETKATATLDDGGKSVILDFSKADVKPVVDSVINVGKVRDAAGNYTTSFVSPVTCKSADLIAIDKVEATGTKTIVVTLKDTLASFDAADFAVNVTVAGVSFANVDGKGVITYTLQDDILTTASHVTVGAVKVTTNSSQGAIKSANALGSAVKASENVTAADKIGPAITSASFNVTGDAIVIVFTENVKADTLSRFTFTVSGNTVTAAAFNGTNTVTLSLKDAVTVAKTKVTLTQVLDIEDSLGNVSKGMTKEIEK